MLMIYSNQLRRWKVTFSVNESFSLLNIHVTQKVIHFTLVFHSFVTDVV